LPEFVKKTAGSRRRSTSFSLKLPKFSPPALEQFACKYPDLDLFEFSVYNEVVDGKIMPPT